LMLLGSCITSDISRRRASDNTVNICCGSSKGHDRHASLYVAPDFITQSPPPDFALSSKRSCSRRVSLGDFVIASPLAPHR
jgi:hypothetical protein